MLEELQPLSLTAAARRLGIDPFEVVRLLVASDQVPAGALAVDPQAIDALRELGRIDSSWWDGVDLPSDEHPGRARVRAAARLLLDRKHVGDDAATRMDNVWRGLPLEDQDLLQRAISALAIAGLVRILATRVGLMVCVADGQESKVKALADAEQVPSELTDVLDGQG